MAAESEETSTISTSTISKPSSNEEHSDCLPKLIIDGNNESKQIVFECVQYECEEHARQQLPCEYQPPYEYQPPLRRSQSEQHLSYNQKKKHTSLLTGVSQVRD